MYENLVYEQKKMNFQNVQWFTSSRRNHHTCRWLLLVGDMALGSFWMLPALILNVRLIFFGFEVLWLFCFGSISILIKSLKIKKNDNAICTTNSEQWV